MVFTNITPFPRTLTPVTNISPLTYRDAATFLEYLETIKQWLNETLVPDSNEMIAKAIEEFQEGIANAEATVTATQGGWQGQWNDWTEEKAAEYLAFSTGLNDAFEAFKTSVNTVIADSITDIAGEKGEWQASFDAFITNVEAEIAAISDAAVGGLVENPASVTGAALRAEFTQVSESVINIERYGAIGDGVTDNTAFINAAIAAAVTEKRAQVFIPRAESFYAVNGTINVPSEIRIFSDTKTEIRGTGPNATMKFVNGSYNQVIDGLYLSAWNGGSVLEINDSYRFKVSNTLLVQYQATRSVISHDGAGSFIDATFENCEFNAAVGASVPAISLVNSLNGLNSTSWKNCRVNGNATMTAPFFYLASNGGPGIWSNNHTFSDITAEVCTGGVIHGESVFGVSIDNVSPWDVEEYTNDVFKFTANIVSGAPPCINIVVQNSGRKGGTIAAGKYDVNFGATSQHVAALFMSPTTAGANFIAKINMPVSGGIIMGSGGEFIQNAYGNVQKMNPISSNDRGVPGLGNFVFDGTLKKPLWGDGATWLDATGNPVNAFTKITAAAGAERAVPGPLGTAIFDYALQKPLWSNGESWLDATGTVVP